jgi:hypothetical protein
LWGLGDTPLDPRLGVLRLPLRRQVFA